MKELKGELCILRLRNNGGFQTEIGVKYYKFDIRDIEYKVTSLIHPPKDSNLSIPSSFVYRFFSDFNEGHVVAMAYEYIM